MEGGTEGEALAVGSTDEQAQQQQQQHHQQQQQLATLAREAATLYNGKSYSDCLKVLHQLLAKKENDPKILHNIALGEFHQDGCTDGKRLRASLEDVTARCKQLSQAADEQLEGVGNNLANSPGSTGTLTKAAALAIDSDDYDTTIPILNKAIVSYHSEQYGEACELLEKLFRNIEPVDLVTALEICLLMMDVHHRLRQPEKVLAVINHMDRTYKSKEKEVQTQAPQTQAAPPAEGKSLMLGISAAPLPSLVSSPIADNAGALGQVAGCEETLEEDALRIGLELDGTHGAAQLLQSRLPPIEKSSLVPATIEVELVMHLYKVRYHLLTGNLKAAMSEVEAAISLSKDNIAALLLKSQIEYSRGNYPKAERLLEARQFKNAAMLDPMIRPILLSNLSCVFQRTGQLEVANFVSKRAILEYNATLMKGPKTLWTFSRERSMAMHYNRGLLMLLRGEPEAAAMQFDIAAPMYVNNAIWWLRRAECCIQALKKGAVKDTTAKIDKLDVVLTGHGLRQRLVLPSGSMNPTVISPAAVEHDRPTISMHLASKCLRKALFELNAEDEQNKVGVEEQQQPEAAVPPELPIPKDSGKMSSSGNNNNGNSTLEASLASFQSERNRIRWLVKLYAMVDLAFVQLCLKDPSTALICATQVLKHPLCGKEQRFLGRVYAAEALCLLSRYNEAEELLYRCLQEWLSGDGNEAENSAAEEDAQQKLMKLTSSQARTTLYVNLAATYALQGELDKAGAFAHKALATDERSGLAVLSLVYVQLVLKNSAEALEQLKQFRNLSVSRPRSLKELNHQSALAS